MRGGRPADVRTAGHEGLHGGTAGHKGLRGGRNGS
jgi:hypothetical protein